VGLPAIDYRHTSQTTQRSKRGSSSSRRPTSVSKSRIRHTKKRSAKFGNARRGATRRTDSARAAFAITCVALCALAIFGLGRVTLAVQATEASFQADQIREDIKAERLTGQLLEVDKSALTTPSRIEAIAGSSMKMAEADDVCYLALPEAVVGCEEPASGPAPAISEISTSAQDGGVLRALMDMAAEEAQVLLVGDVGLSSPR